MHTLLHKTYRTPCLIFVLILASAHAVSAQWQLRAQVISAEDRSPLPYASVYTDDGEFTFTNDDGFFVLKTRRQRSVHISFLGFRDTTVLLSRQDMVIEMVSDAYMTETVVITDKDYISPYETLAKARKEYQKEKKDEIKMKLFVKRESVNNGVWADRTEVLYNYTHKNRRMYDLTFKHGKSYVNTENDVILTLDLFAVLRIDWVFDKKPRYLYPSILSHSSAKKMKKNFFATYSEYTTNGTTYFVIDSEPREGVEGFSSEITIDKESNDIRQIHNRIVNPKLVNFKSIRTKLPIDLRSLDIKYQFVPYDGMTILSHIDISYTYYLNGVESENTLAFHFYSAGSPFLENITSIKYVPLSDYQKVWVNPYSESFWAEQNIAESQLDTVTNYIHMNKKVKALLEKKQYLTLSDVDTLKAQHFEHVPLLDDGTPFRYKYDDMSIPSKLHVEAFFHANVFYKDGEMVYEVQPMVDYKRSFINDSTPLVILQWKKEIKEIRKIWDEYLTELATIKDAGSLTVTDIKKLNEKYNEEIHRRLSKLDKYQYVDWKMVNPLDQQRKIIRSMRRQ